MIEEYNELNKNLEILGLNKIKEELMLAIEKYIDYYTNKRIQRNLGVLTPMEFHKQKLENVA